VYQVLDVFDNGARELAIVGWYTSGSHQELTIEGVTSDLWKVDDISFAEHSIAPDNVLTASEPFLNSDAIGVFPYFPDPSSFLIGNGSAMVPRWDSPWVARTMSHFLTESALSIPGDMDYTFHDDDVVYDVGAVAAPAGVSPHARAPELG